MRGLGQLSDRAEIPAVVALLAATAFRLPELLNPGVVNSDSAVVGLQAMHILRGEWHWFLWGSGYQTTADSVVAAAIFLVLGATPLALMLTALTGHLLAVLFAFLTLCRRLQSYVALLLVMPLIVSPAPTHTYTLHPPRQTALTLVFAAIWMIDGAAQARNKLARFALGAGIGALACFADPYALVFSPALALLVALAGLDGTNSRGNWWRRILAAVAGASLGAIPYIISRLLPRAVHGPLTLTSDLFARNWALLKQPCLPWVLGTTVLHQPPGVSDYVQWHPPWHFQLCQWSGVVSFVSAFLISIGALRRQSVPWESRRLGLVAALTVVTTITGFLLSVMPIDHYASRYLVSLILVAPFLFAVLAHIVSARILFGLMLPMLASFAVSGWLGYEPFVNGVRIENAGLEVDETLLLRELKRRHIAYALADYWAAYRLTFMFKEQVVVVPLHESQDRYLPYRQSFGRANDYVYIYDHRRSEESQQTVNNRVTNGLVEQFSVGNFDVYRISRDRNHPSTTQARADTL